MITEMRMIQWMCDYIRIDRVKNAVIREKIGVAPLEEKMRKSRLRWFRYVKMRGINAPVRRCKAI